MIKEIELIKFKRFNNNIIKLKTTDVTVLAGGNNSGKSTILHALAVWEFCRNYLEFEKGKNSLTSSYLGQGVGINYNDFSPINIPSLKYLWTNLKPSGSYSLNIKCKWDYAGEEHYIKFGLALANERLFIKTLDSSIDSSTKIPVIAYLPPFAGISENENWVSLADRRRMIGRGLAGAILRNTIIDLYNTNIKKKIEAKGERQRIPKVALNEIRANDPYEILNSVLFETFGSWLVPEIFNPVFHSSIHVNIAKGRFQNGRYIKHPGYNYRDIMVEGSGFLQWLSVFTFAVNPDIDILLLDEPDAHLHSSLQLLLFEKLKAIAETNRKQVLFASHSTEIINQVNVNLLMEISSSSCRYLSDDSQKTLLLSGLGSEYSPILNNLQRRRKLLFVENNSDAEILKNVCLSMGKVWPTDLVIWPMPTRHDVRKQIVLRIKDEIPGLTALSLIDRDREEIGTTSITLEDLLMNDLTENNHTLLRYRKWRRRHIESYFILPSVISRLSGSSIDDVSNYLLEHFSIRIPDSYKESDHSSILDPIFHIDSKQVLRKIQSDFSTNKFDISKNLSEDEICKDLETLITEIVTIFN